MFVFPVTFIVCKKIKIHKHFLCMCSCYTGAADGAWLRVASESLGEIHYSGASSVSTVCPVCTSSKQCKANHRMWSMVNINVNEPTLILPCLNSKFILVSEGIPDEIALLLHHNRSSSVIVTRCCEIMASLCSSSIGQQVCQSANRHTLTPVFVRSTRLACVCTISKIGKCWKIKLNQILIAQAVMESQCLSGLLEALQSPALSDETLLHVTSYLHQLMTSGQK